MFWRFTESCWEAKSTPARVAEPKLLYLGLAFPPGVAGRFPEAQPAGHLLETSLVTALRPWFEIRSVGISWIEVEKVPPGDLSPGLPHALNLLDKPPELLHRWNSLLKLKRQYLDWIQAGWRPDCILMYNFSPVYNGFIRWLKNRPNPPRVAVYLADSTNLQQEYPWLKRMRHRLKPLKWPDSEMVRFVDACAAVSLSTKEFFEKRKVPWLWSPVGCDPARAIRSQDATRDGPLRFGFFGSIAPYGGLPALVKVFLSRQRKSSLHICGYGKGKEELAALSGRFPQIRLYPPRSPDECLQFARTCDVLINPRPIVQGNENNLPSKIFEYALSGRAILSSRLSGVDLVLGEEAFYFDEHQFDASLDQALARIEEISRPELDRRGAAIQERVVANYSWAQQAERLAAFLKDGASHYP